MRHSIVCLCVWLLLASPAVAEPTGKNILFILADDLALGT